MAQFACVWDLLGPGKFLCVRMMQPHGVCAICTRASIGYHPNSVTKVDTGERMHLTYANRLRACTQPQLVHLVGARLYTVCRLLTPALIISTSGPPAVEAFPSLAQQRGS